MFDPSMFISDRDTNETDNNGQPMFPEIHQFFMNTLPFDSENSDFPKRDDMMESIFGNRSDMEAFDPSVFFAFDPTFMQAEAQEIQRFMAQPFDFYGMTNPENPALETSEIVKYENQLLPKPKILYSKTTKVGTLTLEERHQKIQKFWEKRKRRNFHKKISYACRKRVADDRIRIRGRFVSKLQADALKVVEDGKNDISIAIKKEI